MPRRRRDGRGGGGCAGWAGVLALVLLGSGSARAHEARSLAVDKLGAGAWPHAWVAELPEGFVRSGERLVLRGSAGQELPCCVDTLASWGPGHPRWCRLRVGELPADQRRLRLEPTRARRPKALLRLEGRRRAGALHGPRASAAWDEEELCIGPFRLQFGRSELELDGVHGGWPRLVAPRLGGPDVAGFVARWAGQGGGGQDAAIQLEVDWSVSSRATESRLVLRLTALQPCVVRRWTLRGRAAEGLDWVAGSQRDRSRARRSLEAGHDGVEVEVGGWPAELPEDLGLACRGQRMSWLEFARRPSGASSDGRGGFVLGLIAEEQMLEVGQCVERVLHFAPDRHAPRRPHLVLRDRGAPVAEEDRAWVERWCAVLEQELRAVQSCEHRGCYPGRRGGHANGEYDLAASLLHWGCRRGDETALRLGCAMVGHQRSFDRAADPPDGWPEGLFWMHGTRHHSGRLEAGHLWIGGLIGAARVEGSEGAWRDVQGMVQGLVELERDGSKLGGPERRLAWPLWAALEALGTRAQAEGLAHRLLDRLLERQTMDGFLGGDERRLDGRDLVWINTWVSLGITLPALLRAADRLGREDARAAALRLGSFLREKGPRTGTLSEVILVDPVFGDVVQRRGRCRGGGAALASAGLRWYAIASADPTVVSLADQLWETARADLSTPRWNDTVEFAQALHALRLVSEAR